MELEHLKKASVLLLVLWILCILTSFSLILSGALRQKLSLIGRIENRDRLHYIAEAGAKIGCAFIAQEEDKGFDSFLDSWADNPAVFSLIPVGGGTVSVTYDYYDDALMAAQPRYGLIDEERKMSLNHADLQQLTRLMQIVLGVEEGRAKDLAAAIIDWRDADSNSASLSAGAESFYYLGLSAPYEAKNAPFEVIDELLLLKDMDYASFKELKDYVTVYGKGKVNINTASRAVLLALGLNEELAEMVSRFRNGQDAKIGTADDNVLESQAAIVSVLSQAFQMSAAQVALLTSVASESLGVSSENFTIKSKGLLPGLKQACEVTCVVNRQGEVLYWRENYN